MKKGFVKVVEWRDSTLHITQEPIDTKWEVQIITSIGFVVYEDKKIIVLAGDTLNEDVRRVIVIPKENII
jgi:hypothetical protein